MHRRPVAVSWLATLLAMALAGCGGSSGTGGPAGTADGGGDGDSRITVDVPGDGPGASLAPAEGWPAAAPKDVPPFPGRLGMLMPQRPVEDGGIRARMFFDGVSREQFFAYVAVLRNNGYQIKGTVFYSEQAEKAEAERRAAAGDVDEITATKGRRVLVIGAPTSAEDVIPFDLCGLTQAESDSLGDGMPVIPSRSAVPDPAAGGWPTGWADRVPAPQGCSLTDQAVVVNEPGMMNVLCAYPDADPSHHQDVVQGYKDVLLAGGFTVTTETTDGAAVPGGVGMLRLTKGSVSVMIVAAGPANSMSISATDSQPPAG